MEDSCWRCPTHRLHRMGSQRTVCVQQRGTFRITVGKIAKQLVILSVGKPPGLLVPPESGMKGARCRSKRPPPVAFARAIFVALDRCVRQGPATARLGIGSQAQESGLSCRRRTETKMRVCRPLAKSAMVNRSPSCVKPAWLKVTSTFRGDRHICAVA